MERFKEIENENPMLARQLTNLINSIASLGELSERDEIMISYKVNKLKEDF